MSTPRHQNIKRKDAATSSKSSSNKKRTHPEIEIIREESDINEGNNIKYNNLCSFLKTFSIYIYL